MKTTFIYCLCDPITKQPKYIGKSNKPRLRFTTHISESKRKNQLTKKEAWIRSIVSRGDEPEMFILDEVPTDNWQFWEMYYISLFTGWGFDLKNGTVGGDGPMFRQKTSEETKRKISESVSLAKKGIPQSEAHKKALSIVRKGRTPWNKGRTDLPTSKKKGIPISNDQKEKIRASLKKWFKENSSHKKIEIQQFDKSGNFIKDWDSIRCAAISLRISESGIVNCCRSRSRTSGGFIWKYKNI